MTAICFHWEPAASIAANPKAVKKLLLHWTHTAKCFGVKDIYCIGSPVMGDQQINWHNIESINDLGRKKLVYVEQGGTPLSDFKHPKTCIYVFGSDYGSLEKADVSIDSELGLYAEQACAIVLHDRYIKHGGN